MIEGGLFFMNRILALVFVLLMCLTPVLSSAELAG